MEEIAVLRACLKRPTVNHPWGFRLRGGADYGQPIRINGVVAGSPASVIGLEADDEVTEIEGQLTASMTHSQVLDAIGRQKGETLLLTIERKTRGSVPRPPEVGRTIQSSRNNEPQDGITGSQGRTTDEVPSGDAPVFQPIHGNSVNNVTPNSPSSFVSRNRRQSQDPPYSREEPLYSPRERAYSVPHEPGASPHQVLDPSGTSRYYPPGPSGTPFEFQTVQSRPFVERVNHRGSHHTLSQPVTMAPPPQMLPVDTDGGFEEAPLGYKSDYLTQQRNAMNEVPQSRTFKILESIMSNEEPYAGVSGLPPPRSAAMEKMKREGSSGSSPSPRVKVLMSQKYNSPLGMYSAKNLIETFAVQAENALETLEK